MATATQKDLLNVARRVNNRAQDRMDRLAVAVKQAADELDETVEPVPIAELQLDDTDDIDPFNGNLNNRRVAARIARGIEVSSGNPRKAKEDVERSLRVNPEPQIKTGDELPEIKLVHDTTGQPTPGSPADLKNGKSQTQIGGQQATSAPQNTKGGETADQSETQAGGKGSKSGKTPPQWKANAS